MKKKIHTQLFLSGNHSRIGEGGLHKQGYFKTSSRNQPLITVITVVFNGEKHLEQTILSVIKQSYNNVEYIIIDGGSTDNTLDIIRRYENQIDYWISEKDNGIYDAFNKGVLSATGEWVCFLGADDFFWNEFVLEKTAQQLIIIPSDIRIVYGQVMLLNYQDEAIYPIGKSWQQVKNDFSKFMSIPHPTMMHHYSLFEQYGYFDDSFRIVGDYYEFLLRELKTGNAFFMNKLIMAGMRQGGISSHPKNTLLSLKESRKAHRIHGQLFPNIKWIMALIRVYIRIFLWRFFGEKITRKALDFGRALMGLPPFWTKT